MPKKIKIFCLNDNRRHTLPAGTDLLTLSKNISHKLKYPVLGAMVNNDLQELSYEIYRPKHIRFIDITCPDGIRMYIRSLSFILFKAFHEKFPNATLRIAHSASNGLYCEIDGLGGVIYDDDVTGIRERMEEIVKQDIPFLREEMENNEALAIYEKNKMYDKCKLFTNRRLLYTSVYTLENTIDYFYGYLVPSTGYIKKFGLIKFHEGLLLQYPQKDNPGELVPFVKQEKMFDIFKEHKKWAKILDVANVGNLNELILGKQVGEIIKISEALHEKKIARIADIIHSLKQRLKLILISGPSSSGKTSFCKRLSIQLRVLGFKAFLISLDDYFVDREQTPRDKNGEYDFECLEAIDIELFNENMLDLMAGKEVELPHFDFNNGKRASKGIKIHADEESVFIVEGIHGLNPGLTPKISNDSKFKIYVSALTQVSIDNHNRIPTTDNRLIRRMVRDFNYRGYSSLETLKRWQSVRRGEDRNIFPFQEEADAMFNSALLYEIAVLKKRALPILQEVPESEEELSEARRLIKFLTYFNDVPDRLEKEIPPTSIIREFIGGSSFKY
ncbi:MAG: nucleoside kinase [Bacteroidetes bacterium]|nr:nucleoside kinase [Bacteroidota bacterium]